MPHQLQSFFTKKTNVRAVTILLSILIVITGFFNYRHEYRTIHRTQEHFLQSVAHLKANQISAWYKDEIHDAEIIAHDFFLLEYIQKWLAEPSTINREWLLRYLSAIRDVNDYDDLLLTTTKGRLLLSLDPEITQLDSSLIHNIRRAVASDSLIVTDFYRCPMHRKIRLDIIRPLKDGKNANVALVFKLDPETFLFPIVKSWPVPSKSAETLIVRQAGDSVLFINELRHLRDTALNLKFSLKELNVPAVQAVRGYRGIWSGRDYRGVNVLADVRPISGTPWFMIAKIDQSELYAELRSKGIYTILFVFILVLLIAAGLGFLYYLKQRDVYRQLYRSQQEFHTTLNSIGDAVITTDIRGKIKYLNPVAEELTGWRERQVAGKPLWRAFKIVNAQTGKPAPNPVQRVLETGKTVGLANHTKLIAKNGAEYQIADSAAPIRGEDGKTRGVVLVFRDVSKEYQMREALKESEAFLSNVIESIQDGISVLDSDLNITLVNSVMKKWYKQNIPLEGKKCFQCYHNAEKPCDPCPSLRCIKSGKTEMDVVKGLPGSPIQWIELFSYPIKSSQTGEIIGVVEFVRDITKRKQAEEQIKRFSRLFEDSLNEIYIFNSENLKFIQVNEAAQKNLGYSQSELRQLTPLDIKPEFTREQFQQLISPLLTGSKEKLVFETIHRRKDKSTYDVEVHLELMDFEDEKVFVAFINDITERKRAEEALRESEEKYRSLFNQSTEGIYLHDLEGRILDVNEMACAQSGYSRDEWLRRTIFDGHPSKSTTNLPIDDVLRIWKEEWKPGQQYTVQAEHQRKDGTVYPVEISTGIIRYQDKNAILAIVKDITERKQAEEKLKSNYALLQIAGETARFGGWSVDLEKNICTWSDAVADIHEMPHGYAPKVEDGISFYAPEWRDKITQVFTACAENGIPYDEEMEIITKKGKRVWVRTIGRAVKDEKGDIIRVEGSFQDISEKKKAEKLLQDERQQLLSVFNGIEEAIYITDPETYEVLYVNNFLKSLLGSDPLGKKCYEQFQGLNAPCEFCTNQIILQNPEEVYHWEYYNPILKRDYLLFDRIIKWSDGRNVRFEMAVDITERKRAEEALRSIEWMLSKKAAAKESEYVPLYGDLAELNTKGLILDSVEKNVLKDIVDDYLKLLETSSAVYEKNGDYALGIFSSGWCRFMDQASRELCNTDDNSEALNCGKWLCHESCWKEASLPAIESGLPVDIECQGGIHLYALPIVAGDEVIGAINFGYGDPPRDKEKLSELAEKYKIPLDELVKKAEEYESRPPYIIEMAKERLQASANLIGEIVSRKITEKKILTLNEQLEQKVAEKTKELNERVAELERFHDATIEREFRIKELRDEIERLKRDQK